MVGFFSLFSINERKRIKNEPNYANGRHVRTPRLNRRAVNSRQTEKRAREEKNETTR